MDDLISRQAAIDALDCINGAEEVLRSLLPAQPEEAIPVAWISAQIERLKGMDNMRVDFIAEAIQTTLNEWRKEQEGETT